MINVATADLITEGFMTGTAAQRTHMWRLRRDTRGEVGVFEDLQTLLVVVVGIAILLGSTLYNWSAISTTEQDQDLYDEAEHIVKQIEADEHLWAVNSYGDRYNDFYLKQSELLRLHYESENKTFIRSDYHYSVVFDDLNQHENETVTGSYPQSNPINITWLDRYHLGESEPVGKEMFVLQTKYTMVMDIQLDEYEWDVSVRHVCLVTVEVWR
jgi:hypothetical protein